MDPLANSGEHARAGQSCGTCDRHIAAEGDSTRREGAYKHIVLEYEASTGSELARVLDHDTASKKNGATYSSCAKTKRDATQQLASSMPEYNHELSVRVRRRYAISRIAFETRDDRLDS
jgi:hypothetical protein